MTPSKSCFAAVVLSFALLPIVHSAGTHASYVPPNGFVPDEKTAIRVAEALLTPIFGEKPIESERPFSAALKGDIWIVTGHFPEGMANGGVAEIRISKKTCQVIYVTHGK